MSKVSMHIGFTFRVGPLDQNQYGRIDLTVDQIDTDLPIEPQLTDAGIASDKVYEFVKEKIDSQIDGVLDSNE